MNKLSLWLEEKLLPLAGKLSKQRHLKAISDTFMSVIPFLTIGSLALVLIEPPVDFSTLNPGFLRSFMEGWSNFAGFVGLPVGTIYLVTMEFLSLMVAAGIGYYLGKHYGLKGFIPTLLSVVSYLILAGVDVTGSKTFDFMGGTGLFAAIIAAIISIELLRILLNKKVGYISLEGHGVPEALSESFAMLAPVTIVLIVMALIHTAIVSIASVTFPALLSVVIAPLLSATNSLWGGMILVFIVMTLWWFGIHDTVITGPMGVFWLTALTANITAYQSGVVGSELPFIITEPLWWFFIMIGGSGATFGLIFILLFVAKSKHLKTVGKLGLVPGIFNINEPLIFGVPLMMNPVMFIPFVGVPLVNFIVSYLAMAVGFVGKTVSYPGWNMFSPVAALLSTLDFRALLLVIGLIVIDALIYLPFIKVFDRVKVEEEKSETVTIGN